MQLRALSCSVHTSAEQGVSMHLLSTQPINQLMACRWKPAST